MSHEVNDVEIKTGYETSHSFLFDYSKHIVDNHEKTVDFDSAEHLPTTIKKYFLQQPKLQKNLYLAIHNLEEKDETASQVIKSLVVEKTSDTEYLLPQVPNSHDTGVSSIWSVTTFKNQQHIVLHLFFDSTEKISSWLVSLGTSDHYNFFREAFDLITMGLVRFPFRGYYYLDYNKKPRHHKFKYVTKEEVQQCDAFLRKIIEPMSQKNRKQRLVHLTDALNQVSLDGLFMEFGVWKGETVTHIAKTCPQKTIHGFDSFEGLQEEWNNSPPGHFNLNGELPVVPSNVRLHKGYFCDVLPIFKQQIPKKQPIAFLHVDCDLYSSTKDIFRELGEHIVPGTIIAFDDFLYNTNWIQHEPLAFAEFLKERPDLTFTYITYTGSHQVVVKMLARDA